MRAAVARTYGAPAAVISVEEVPTPRPAPGQVLVQVRVATVNRTDCGFLRASPFVTRAVTGLRRPRQPIFGCEFAGVVVELGAGVSDRAVGDRVFGYREPAFGCHAEYVAVGPDEYVAPIPDAVAFDQAAAATEGAHYALSAIRATGVRPGHQVLVYGATGAIGSAAVQLLRHFGAEVTAVAGTAGVARVRALGIDRVVDFETQDLTRLGTRFDLVLDAVGKLTRARCRDLLGPRGVYCSSELGPWGQNPLFALAGPMLPAPRVVFAFPRLRAEDLELIRGSLEDRTFQPMLDRAYPLEEIVAAYEYVETGHKQGNVLLTVRG